MQIRPFLESDYPAYVGLLNAVYPDSPQAETDVRDTDSSRTAGDLFGRFLAESEGRVVGSVAYQTPWNYQAPGRLQVHIRVRPETEHLRGALWRFLMEQIAPLQPTSLLSNAREDRPELPFYMSQGFRELDRMWASTLDLTSFDAAPFRERAAMALRSGITIRTLAELPYQDEGYLRKHYRLICALLAAVPSAVPVVPWSFELWQERSLNRHNLRPDGYFIATDGEEEVGLSQLWGSSRPQTLATGLTGVLKEYRRRGIALALKLAAAEHARAAGYRYVWTANHSINRPMLSINEEMGFVKEPATVNLVKDLHCAPGLPRVTRPM